jgi:urease accessory protein UreF
MNRQLQADGGIMQVAPREKFGLGSKLKKFVRKIIPNEVAEVAVKAAPFVAPFNPAVAAAMSGQKLQSKLLLLLHHLTRQLQQQCQVLVLLIKQEVLENL